jgi:hypothetical protein
MSKGICCDRCGKLQGLGISFPDRKTIFPVGPDGWEEITTHYDVNTDTIKSFSLCPDCANDFVNFMAEKKVAGS